MDGAVLTTIRSFMNLRFKVRKISQLGTIPEDNAIGALYTLRPLDQRQTVRNRSFNVIGGKF